MKRTYSAVLAKLLAVVMIVTALLVTLPAINVSAADNFIITLDPGHGPDSSGTPGAVQFGGLNEYLYTYMLANLVKERLLQYEGVTVYFTRTETETPGLAERAEIAAKNKSDAFISIHNNASGTGSQKGAMILVPNENYRPEISKASCAAANIILDQMAADTGVKNLGLLFKQGSGTYPDGSTTDYYGIIKNGKLQNIPVVMLIETAFADNQEDYYNHLATDAARKRSAYAIADGIAKAFNFTPKAGADLSKPEAPVIPEFTEPIKFQSSVDHVNGKGPNGEPNFAGYGGNSNGGANTIDALSEGVYIRKDGKLTIGGWLGVDGGTARFVYSLDGGETWMDVPKGGYDGEPLHGHYERLGFTNATKLGMFNNNKSPLTVDLSAYAGDFVDVTFAAVSAEDNTTVIPFITILSYLVPGEKPAETTTEPETTTAEPEVTTTEPEVTTTEPEVTTTEPEETTTEPEVTTTEPEVTTTEPEVTTTEPEVTTVEPEVTTVESEAKTDAPAEKKGCGSAVSGAVAIVGMTLAAGAAFLARKKKD